MEYRYEVTEQDENGTPLRTKRHDWVLVGPEGAVNIWAVENCDELRSLLGRDFYGGVEIHHRVTPRYRRGEDPDHTDCELLGGVCWHNGSSLYFQRSIAPFLSRNGPGSEMSKSLVYSNLLMFYKENFNE